MRRHCIHAFLQTCKTWTKPVQVAAVGIAVNNDRYVHDTVDACFVSLLNAIVKFPTFQLA